MGRCLQLQSPRALLHQPPWLCLPQASWLHQPPWLCLPRPIMATLEEASLEAMEASLEEAPLEAMEASLEDITLPLGLSPIEYIIHTSEHLNLKEKRKE